MVSVKQQKPRMESMSQLNATEDINLTAEYSLISSIIIKKSHFQNCHVIIWLTGLRLDLWELNGAAVYHPQASPVERMRAIDHV